MLLELLGTRVAVADVDDAIHAASNITPQPATEVADITDTLGYLNVHNMFPALIPMNMPAVVTNCGASRGLSDRSLPAGTPFLFVFIAASCLIGTY